MEIKESGLQFSFDDTNMVIKFDDARFYRTDFSRLPGSKGIDILAVSNEAIHFIEIKNCTGHERENRWRMSVNNSKIDSAPAALAVEHRESLDIEMAKKVSMTLTCLYGSWSKSNSLLRAEELAAFFRGLSDEKILKNKKKLIITLFVEGDFSAQYSVRTKKMMMQRLQDSLKNKLSWLNCQVAVVDSDTYNSRYFKVDVTA